MTEQPFDRRLKGVLENLEPPYDPTTWERLQRRLDAQTGDVPPAVDDAAWDAGIRERLERLSASYEAAGWQTLLAKMRLQTRRQWYVYGAKAVEVLLLLLLVWLWAPEQGRPPAQPCVPSSSQAIAQNAEDVRAAKSVPPEPSSVPSSAFSTSVSVSKTDATKTTVAHPAHGNELWPQNAGEYSDVSLPAANADSWAEELSLRSAFLSPLSVPIPVPLSSAASSSAAIAPIPSENRPEPAAERRFYLLGAVSVQRNYNSALPDAQRVTCGYGFLLRAEYRKRAWAWGTGLEYASLAFAPRYQERIFRGTPQTGYYAASMAEVRADMLLFPFVVSRRIRHADRWQVWVMGGFTAHLALDKAYDYDYRYYLPGHLPLTQADPNAQPHLLERGRGLLEGGGFASNAYASADVGLRWEYGVAGGRYGWYVQPLYRRGLTPGIGPNAKPLHAWALQVGLRMTP